MMLLVIVALIVAYIISPVWRCALKHPFLTIRYAVKDTIKYIRSHGWNECKTGEIVGFLGLFGLGKTLSLVHKVIGKYMRYNGKKVYDFRLKKWVTQRVIVISNVVLSIPYQKFVSMKQIVDAGRQAREYDEEHDTRTITLVLGDEFSVQMNSREFKKNFNASLLNSILTCRHNHLSLYYSAQRFNHVDALLRQVTSYVVDCRKLWRFQRNYEYDAYEMEYATNPLLLRPLYKGCWFVCDEDYNAYDTMALVDNLTKSWEDGDMMSEEEILALQQNMPTDMDAVLKPSRKYVKAQRKRRK